MVKKYIKSCNPWSVLDQTLVAQDDPCRRWTTVFLVVRQSTNSRQGEAILCSEWFKSSSKSHFVHDCSQWKVFYSRQHLRFIGQFLDKHALWDAPKLCIQDIKKETVPRSMLIRLGAIWKLLKTGKLVTLGEAMLHLVTLPRQTNMMEATTNCRCDCHGAKHGTDICNCRTLSLILPNPESYLRNTPNQMWWILDWIQLR